MYLLICLLLALLTAAIIVLLHRDQARKRAEIADLTAPLTAPDLPLEASPAPAMPDLLADVPVFTASLAGSDPAATEQWQEQLRQLRDAGQIDAALQLCRQLFPRIQAFQQAAVLLRQQIRTQLEQHQDARRQLRELYRIAVMADLYRSSNPQKPRDARHTLQQLLQLEFDYRSIGTRHLRLLTKSDIRHLEQLWGRPEAQRHAEDCPGLDWAGLCK
jgi:hypothetical protein